MRGSPVGVRHSLGVASSSQPSPDLAARRLRMAALAASGLVLGAMAALVVSPSRSAAEDAGVHAFQMQESRGRTQRAPAQYAAPVQYYAPLPLPRQQRGGFQFFQPVVRSFAPAPAPSRALPSPIEFGYGTTGTEDAPRALKAGRRDQPALSIRKKAKKSEEGASRSAGLQSHRTMCVRLCDGYAFPIGVMQSSSDWSSHASLCQAACPAADVRLYSLAPGAMDMGTAISRDGPSYASLSTAFAFRKARSESCTCQAKREGTYMSLLRDFTMRAGDTVIVASKAKVFDGGDSWPYKNDDFQDFRQSGQLSKEQRKQIDSMTATTANAEILKRYTIAKAPAGEAVAVIRPQTQPTQVRTIAMEDSRPALRPSQGFTIITKTGGEAHVVNVRSRGFEVR